MYASITDGRDLNTSQVQPQFGNNQTPGASQFAVGFAFNRRAAVRWNENDELVIANVRLGAVYPQPSEDRVAYAPRGQHRARDDVRAGGTKRHQAGVGKSRSTSRRL